MKVKGWKFETAIRRLQEWKLLAKASSRATPTCSAGASSSPDWSDGCNRDGSAG